jgi:hypothetical protein
MPAHRCHVGLLLAAALCAAVSRADDITQIINQATLGEYQGYLRVLTGVDPVPGVTPEKHLQNRYSYYNDIRVAGQWIADQFAALGLNASFDTFNAAMGPNVVGELPGRTRPADIYVICGHLDTYHGPDQSHAPGCDDDGSGVAAVMTAARILSRYRFDATIRFIAWSGEEQWMVGSQDYAADARSAGENIVGAINFDMILHPGFDNQEPDPDYDLEIESNAASEWLAQHMAAQMAAYTPLVYEVHVDPNLVSDHWAFWQCGYDAIGLCENTAYEIWGGSNDTYHQLTDTVDHADYDWDFALHTVRGGMAGLVSLAGLVPVVAGDVNCDGAVDFDDINPFVLRLTSAAGYRAAFPNCPDAHGDANGDGVVDFGDINPFVSLLVRQ